MAELEDVMLDTSFLILLQRKKMISRFVEAYNGYLPDIALFEFLRGQAYIGRDIATVKRYLEVLFSVVRLTNGIIERASELWAELAKSGQLIPEPDVLIASYALELEIPLVTLDRHFEKLGVFGLKLVDPSDVITRISSL